MRLSTSISSARNQLSRSLRELRELRVLGMLAVGAIALTVGTVGWGACKVEPNGNYPFNSNSPSYLVVCDDGGQYNFGTALDGKTKAENFLNHVNTSPDLDGSVKENAVSWGATVHRNPSTAESNAVTAPTAVIPPPGNPKSPTSKKSTSGSSTPSTTPPGNSAAGNGTPPSGTTPATGTSPTTGSEQAGNGKNFDAEMSKARRKHRDDPCQEGAAVNSPTYSCKSSNTMLDMAGGASMMSTQIGQTAVKGMANSEYQKVAQNQALGKPVSQSEIINSGARQQRNAANVQKMQGGFKLGLAAMAAAISVKHNSRAKKATQETEMGANGWTQETDPTKAAIKDYVAVGQTSKWIEEKGAMHGAQVEETGATVAAEQKAMADHARNQAIMHGMMGAAEVMSAMAAEKGAKEMEKAAQNLADAGGGEAPGFQIPEPMPVPSTEATFGPGMPSFGGVGGNMGGGTGNFGQFGPSEGDPETVANATDPNGPAGDVPTLGAPLGGGNPGEAPFAGKDVALKAPEGAGGAGGGGYAAGGAGGGAGGERAESGEAQAQLAGNISQAGQGTSGKGGGGKGGAGGGGGDTDLSKMFASLMGKAAEDDKEKKSILELGRRPASADGDDSLLDKNANLFERISSTYAEKQKRGFVGI